MVENISFLNVQSPLSIGNAVNVGFRLYRSHLKLYSKLAIIAHIWVLVPIYGWAKFFTLSAVISRLAFKELLGQPESASSDLRKIEHRMWTFLVLGILGLIIPFFISVISSTILVSIFFILLHFISPLLLKDAETVGAVGAFILLTSYILIYFWITSRLLIVDLILVMGNNKNPLIAIKDSIKATKLLVNRVQGIIIISFLITLPALISVWWAVAPLVRFVSRNFLAPYIVNANVRTILVFIFLNLLIGVIVMPFWQAMKAVVYYDIRCRQEGLDLKLRTLAKNRVREDI
jgi:hypothetical protein